MVVVEAEKRKGSGFICGWNCRICCVLIIREKERKASMMTPRFFG